MSICPRSGFSRLTTTSTLVRVRVEFPKPLRSHLPSTMHHPSPTSTKTKSPQTASGFCQPQSQPANHAEDLTLWQTMFNSQGAAQQTLSNEEYDVPRDDPIEQHRKKREAFYEKQKATVTKQSSFDSRLDLEEKRSNWSLRSNWSNKSNRNDANDGNGAGKEKTASGGGIMARIRKGRPPRGEQPESAPAGQSFEFEREVGSGDNWSMTESVTKIINDSTQRTATYRQFGGSPLDLIKVEETSTVPAPSAPDRVVVKVSASTVTLQDCLIRRGLDFNITEPVGLPAVSGRDFVGFVFMIGTKVTKFKPGDRVAGIVRSGGNARYVEISQDSLVAVPKSLDAAEAACMVSIYTAAYQAINLATKDSSVYNLEGKQVLVVGGMDGIGQAIIQMCRKAKAAVFATAPDRRHAYVRSILNATPLPENKIEWATIAKDSMDVVFDGVCEGNMDASFAALNDTGNLVCFGHSSMLLTEMGWFGVPLDKRLQRMQLETKLNVQFHDIWDSFRRDPDLYKKNLVALFQLLQMKKIKPQIAKRVSMDEVGLSHRKLEQGQVRGTVVCLPWRRVSKRNIHKMDKEKEATNNTDAVATKEKSGKESKTKSSKNKKESKKEAAKKK